MTDSPDKHHYLTCLKCNKKSLLWDARCKRFLCMGKDCAASFRLSTMNDADQDIVGRMQHALEDIDGAIMPADQREADTKMVGVPVSPYCVDYDEQGVVERVRAFVEAQATEIKRLTTERDNYEGILRVVCKSYKHDTTGYFTPEAEKAAQATAAKEQRDAQ